MDESSRLQYITYHGGITTQQVILSPDQPGLADPIINLWAVYVAFHSAHAPGGQPLSSMLWDYANSHPLRRSSLFRGSLYLLTAADHVMEPTSLGPVGFQ